MYISNSVEAIEDGVAWSFVSDKGNIGVKEIFGEMFDDYAVAEERARYELITGGYSEDTTSFTTHRMDLAIGQVIEVGGLVYRIVDLRVNINRVSMTTSVQGVRYE